MDTLAQQFIAVVNKVRTELRTLADRLYILSLRIQEQTKAISKTGQTCDPTPVVRAELYVPEADKHKKEAESTETKWLGRLNTLLQFLTLAAVVWYASTAHRQWRTMDEQREISQRPWIGIDNTSGDGVSIGGSLLYTDIHKTQASFYLRYRLMNYGRSPANVFGYGHIVEGPIKDWRDLPNQAQQVCDEARSVVAAWTWTVMPQSPMILSVAYDGTHSDHSPQMKISPNTTEMMPINIGCILYRSVQGDTAAIHQTPFIAHISMAKDGGPTDFEDQIPIKLADGILRKEQLRVIVFLNVGKAD